MKVIKEGTWNIVWTTRVSCPTCEAELEVEESDVKPTYNVIKYECVCCVCGKTIAIANENIAQRVREAADKKRLYARSDRD